MDEHTEKLLLSVKKYGKRGKGRSELIKHLKGAKNSPLKALNAKCYECRGYNADGMVDCGIADCPLYPWMPYRRSK